MRRLLSVMEPGRGERDQADEEPPQGSPGRAEGLLLGFSRCRDPLRSSVVLR